MERARFDGDLLRVLIEAAGIDDLVALGLLLPGGEPTREGVVALGLGEDPLPPWMGFELRRWAGAVVDRATMTRPLERRRLPPPTPLGLDALADQAATRLAAGGSSGMFDATKGALREVLVNAVVHRDYTLDVPIRVDFFTDAVAVRSPGLPERADLEDGAFVGRGSRNPHLQFLFHSLGFGQYNGTGWHRAQALAYEAGLDLRADAVAGDVEVVLGVEPRRRVAVERAERSVGEARTRLTPATREDQVVELLADGRWWAPGDIATNLGIPRSSLTVALKRLHARGRIQPSQARPRAPSQRWRLVR
ncbi:MAG: hypothetical protein H6737_11060 [Alphaproteobacteria bacterium]|nr:hypothetical protein [Alphaproteobacteria bacterium]